MAESKIALCNLALAMLGADAIRSFDEKNSRARMCDVFYDFTRNFLLTKFDWPFSRRVEELQELDKDTYTPVYGMAAYGLPADCLTPRDVEPAGSRNKWRVVGNNLYCERMGSVILHYTSSMDNPNSFSDTFSHLLTLGLAVKLSPVITQDTALTRALFEQYTVEQRESWESDANIGSDYREYDEDPDNDTFVNPGVLRSDPNKEFY